MRPAVKKREVWPGSSPTGKMRTIVVTVSKTVQIAIDEAVIAQGLLPDNPIFGKSVTLDDVFMHIAFNLVCNRIDLSQIDGYANCSNESARVSPAHWDVEVEREITTARAPTKSRG